MKLPRLPYNLPRQSRQLAAFGGLNLTDAAQEGELREGSGLTTARYPFLAQRTGRTLIPTGEEPETPDVEDVYSWNGSLIYTAGGVLYRDGEAITNVSPGKKQWAVVNTKLIVWPDMLCIDLTDNTFTRLDAEVETSGVTGSVSFTGSSITAELEPKFFTDVMSGFGVRVHDNNCLLYDYRQDAAAVSACFTAGVGWNAEALEQISGFYLGGLVSGPGTGAYYWISNDNVGDIFIPKIDNDAFKLVAGWYSGDEDIRLPDTSLYNDQGYYARLTRIEYPAGHDGYAPIHVYYDVYLVGTDVPLFSGSFNVGDYVNVTGTLLGLNDAEKVRVTGVEDSTNTMTFAAKTFRNPQYIYELDEDLAAGSYRLYYSADGTTHNFRFTTDKVLEAGLWLYVPADTTDTKVYVWDDTAKEVKAEYDYTTGTGGTMLEATVYDTSAEVVTVQRNVPDLDYICSRDNRLWGVSNSARTIYASALGLPWDFWTYGTGADVAWAAAVGTDEDWTGICAYGSSVLCWKERHLHKVMGSIPAEFYYNTYEFPGVQAGSHRSMEIIDEVLYYKGVHGVYSFAGGAPNLISIKLGDQALTEAEGGDDGRCYHMSALTGDGAVHYVYDTVTGMWTCEGQERADGFAQVGGVLHLLTGGKIYRCDGGQERFKWYAELCPFDETALNRKGYAQLILRFDMEAGSWLRIETRLDRGRWLQAAIIRADSAMTKIVPLVIGRCDRVAVRFSGEGRTVLRSMARHYTAMSEV